VELAGQIRELATKTLRAEFRHIAPQDAGCYCWTAARPRWPRSAPNCPAAAGVEVRDNDGNTWGWLFIHVGFMTGFRNRFGAVLSWCTRWADRARILSASRCSRPGGPPR
jgi:hypothetical protein